jgi:hypothetical protein
VRWEAVKLKPAVVQKNIVSELLNKKKAVENAISIALRHMKFGVVKFNNKILLDFQLLLQVGSKFILQKVLLLVASPYLCRPFKNRWDSAGVI